MTAQVKKVLQTHCLTAKQLNIETPDRRVLFCDLNLSVNDEKVALLGRNGMGKSTLLKTLQGTEEAAGGRIYRHGECLMVSQHLHLSEGLTPKLFIDELFKGLNLFGQDIERHFADIGLRGYNEMKAAQGFSFGEIRKLHLLNAKLRNPAMLLLDEPTQDLDEAGLTWLIQYIEQSGSGMIVSCDDQRLLQHFQHFFLADETGCRYFGGNVEELTLMLEQEHLQKEKQYRQSLNRLEDEEAHFRRVSYRREQKKNQGRVREIKRGSPRTVLNLKRSSAQQSQARLANIRGDKIASIRALTKAARRKLNVELPMDLVLPKLPVSDGQPVIKLQNVSHLVSDRVLFKELNLSVCREKLALVGHNGSGKSTLLEIANKALRPIAGTVQTDTAKTGYIAQGAANWMRKESLLDLLDVSLSEQSMSCALELLQAFKFPLSLAQRPFNTLAAGERIRAALLCLLSRTPTVEVLLLDEPTNGLDLVAHKALKQGLKAWQGGLIVASHDKEFLQAIGCERFIRLGE